MVSYHTAGAVKWITLTACLTIALLFRQPSAATQFEPRIIPDGLTCGKCGMFPARYPRWQSQIIFSDGSMSAFDGCKCMFGFIFDMNRYDAAHNENDIAQVWVRGFNSGEWIDAKTAHFVVGSDIMGPMGKELIPFGDRDSAVSFQNEHGGQLAGFDAVNAETLKQLMGKMHMNGGMKMEGKMEK